MKELKFDSSLGYQKDAVASVVGIFRGQESCGGVFTLAKTAEEDFLRTVVTGTSNVLRLAPEKIVANVREIQGRNGLVESSDADVAAMNFSVQMETGTGKTYVYLRTIFELNREYSFTKFIIVVPSIAIKEGVASSIRLMTGHFRAQYNNAPFDWFVYDSAKLEAVRSFAVSNGIQIMIINIDAFRKVVGDGGGNVFHRYIDKMLGRPVDFVAKCRPVVIIDEPQSVDNTPKAKEALRLLNPLCQLRYSATHRKGQKYCLMYRLDSVDAYNQKLVKQIEVAGIDLETGYNSAHVRLDSVSNAGGRLLATVEIDVKKCGAVSRKKVKVKTGDDLKAKSGGRSLYEGYYVDEIVCEPGNEYVAFSNDKVVRLGQTVGGDDVDMVKRLQIRKTIEEHFEKKLALNAKGVKVLSLFFIDRVENYRVCRGRGKYAVWFEEEFAAAAARPKFASLFTGKDVAALAAAVHDGYFSIDRKGASVDTTEGSKTGREDAERGYSLIMKNKTLLLSFESPVEFIFSHSALKEGWDNPNVFQICTLNEISSDMRRRQMIGRGLRLCVNQDGERVHGFEANTLTVMANESFASFAENLQKEIEEDGDFTFGRSVPIKNRVNRVPVRLKKGMLLKPEFKELWDRIKYKTTYRVDFDSAELIDRCVNDMREESNLRVDAPKYVYAKSEIAMDGAGVRTENETVHAPVTITGADGGFVETALPDIVGYLQNETNLTRRTIVEILVRSGRLGDFRKNPQMFLEGTVRIVRRVMAALLVDGIKYVRLGETDIWAQALFENEELSGYFDAADKEMSNLVETPGKGLYDYAIYDSEVERDFALDLERCPEVKLFAKLPDWFRIPTPLGTYNPDWAVVVEREGEKKLYFVVETKGTNLLSEVPEEQREKIRCGQAHFAAISADAGSGCGYIAPVKDFTSFAHRW